MTWGITAIVLQYRAGSRTIFHEPEAELELSEPFVKNRNRKQNCAPLKRKPFPRGTVRTENSPDPPALAFWISFLFLCDDLCFLCVLSFTRILRIQQRERTPCLFGVFFCCLSAKKGLEGQGGNAQTVLCSNCNRAELNQVHPAVCS